MPFGLKSAPATFEHTIDQILGDIKGEYVDVLMDDFVIFCHTFEEHHQHVCEVLH